MNQNKTLRKSGMSFLYLTVLFGMFLFLLCCPADGMLAVHYGLQLWSGALVPSLLPFLILSGFLVKSGMLQKLSGRFQSSRILSVEGVFAVFAGFLCGFPSGARILGDLRRSGRISRDEAQTLVCFCNNAGPGFVVNYLLYEKLAGGDPSFQTPALVCIYGIPLSALFFSLLFKAWASRSASPKNFSFPVREKAPRAQITFGLLDACIYDACITILKLGGYIVLFCILSEMTALLPFLSPRTSAILAGVLELTGGIDRICLAFSRQEAFLLAIPLTIFGGLCTLAQTASVLKGSGLSLYPYLMAKLLMSLAGFAGAAFCCLILF